MSETDGKVKSLLNKYDTLSSHTVIAPWGPEDAKNLQDIDNFTTIRY
jgi:hypothetical protein